MHSIRVAKLVGMISLGLISGCMFRAGAGTSAGMGSSGAASSSGASTSTGSSGSESASAQNVSSSGAGSASSGQGGFADIDGQYDTSNGSGVIRTEGDRVLVADSSYVMDLHRDGDRLVGRWCGAQAGYASGTIELRFGDEPGTLVGDYTYDGRDGQQHGWHFTRSNDQSRWESLHAQAAAAHCD